MTIFITRSRSLACLVTTMLAIVTCAFATPAHAQLRLPAIIGDHMVLQRGEPVPIWGWMDRRMPVNVTIGDQSHTARPDENGRWEVMLDPMEPGPPLTMTITTPTSRRLEKIIVQDILVGEVWVCSGQSNMEWAMNNVKDADMEIAAANHPDLRIFKVAHASATTPQDDCQGAWQRCAPSNVGPFGAVAYFFGRHLQNTLDVPVGLLETAWGGTRAEAWTEAGDLAGEPFLQPLVDHWNQRDAAYDLEAEQARLATALVTWEEAKATAEAAGERVPNKPRLRADPSKSQHHNSNLYNGMIAPVIPYAFQGAIWYQGESNAGRAHQYRTLFPLMIQSWRNHWGQGEFPFYFVQLANFRAIKPEPAESDWAELREAQTMTLARLPNTGMAVITDIGRATDIHPRNKQDVGKRLARLALVNDYGMVGKILANGPAYQSMDVQENKIVLHFDLGNGPARALMALDRQPLSGFAIAGEDRKFVWGQAKIVGETIEVTHPDIPDPVAVRYNWADNPQGNLYNRAFLPAWPFRTDDWPGVTVGRGF